MLIIALAIGLGLAAIVIAFYNRLVGLRNRGENAWSDIDVQLKRRHELVPNLVETVKGYAAHEKRTFQEVTEARTRAMQPGAAAARAAAEGDLSRAITALFAVAESYPQLRATIPRTLFRLSTVNATPTFVLSLTGISAGEALGYSPDDGLLYRASGFGTRNVDEIFQKISPATLRTTTIVLNGDDYSEAEGLTYEGSGIFLLSDLNRDLFRVVADGEDCLSCPQDCNGLQTGDPANFFCCGDGDGVTPVSCQDPRCTTGGKSCN